MAYVTGTADNYLDLLDRLVSFLTTNADLTAAGQNWQTLSTVDEGYPRQYFLQAPGLTGQEEIYINIRAFEQLANDRYNWHVKGALGYIGDTGLTAQPNSSPASYVYLWNQSTPYWLVANGQRVIVVAKISTTYVVFYLGKILPYGKPAAFPYPLLIGGVGNTSGYRWSDSSATYDISCVMSPGTGSQFYTTDGGWRQIMNRYQTSYSRGEYINMYPTAPGGFFRAGSQSWKKLSPISSNIDGSYNLMPFFIGTDNDYPSRNCFGELDGLFWVTGIGNAAENIVTQDGVDHLVVQNLHRTDWEEYAAVRLQ